MTSYLPTTAITSQGGSALLQALELLEIRLRAWAADAEAFAVVLRQVYGAEASSAAATALRRSLLGEGLGLSLDVAPLPGLRGAYAAATASAGELVLLDGAWLAAASAAELEALLLEELGHALDWRLHGAIDSPGDEGEIFSALLRGATPSAASYMENDHRWIEIAGQRRLVEAGVADTTAPTVELNGTVTPSFAGSSIGFGLPALGPGAKPAFADIDGDGDPDAFIGIEDGNIYFFLNSGSASAAAFAGPSIGFDLPDVGYNSSPTFVDIDADGDLDAFVGNRDGVTSFFLNTGSASAAAFAAPTSAFDLTDVGYNASPTFGDIDGDGDLDSFIGERYGSTIFFLNTGSATAAAFAGSSLGFGLPDVGVFASPTLVDIDSDGDLDAFIGADNGRTFFFLNSGSASAAAFAGSAISFGLTAVGVNVSPTFVDIDADGDVDAFIGDAYGNVFFFRNSGGGVISTNPNDSYAAGSVITIVVPFTETVLVDTTGGVPSLLLETGATDRAAIYSGGSGTRLLSFTYTVQPGDISLDLDYTSSSALQLNGATIQDPAGNNANLTLPAPGSAGSLGVNAALVIGGVPPTVLLNGVVAPAFSGSSLGFSLGSVGSLASPTFADIDADGDLDAFIGNRAGDILFFLNTGTATMAAFAESSLGFGLPNVGGYASPAFADIDADGDLDAFIGERYGSTIFFLNTGSASAAAFAASSIAFDLPNVVEAAAPSFADIDGDGDLDAFLGNGDGSIIFCRNTGSASSAAFAASSIGFDFPVVGLMPQPTFADIDGDGDLDAFIGGYYGSTIFFRNTGSATAAAFAASSLGFGLPDVGYNASPAFADIDGDGDLDAFIGDGSGNTLFFRNSGSGIASPNPNGIYSVGSVITILVPFSEAVLVNTSGGVPTLLLATGSTESIATYSGGSGTNVLSFTYTVRTGDSSTDLDYRSSSALVLNGGTIKNLDGVKADLSLPAPGSAGSLGANAALVIDGVPATVELNGTVIPAFEGSSIGFGLPNVVSIASPTFADIDADGDLDAFIGNHDGNVVFFLNTGSATSAAFAGSSLAFGSASVGDSASPTLVDIDADGDLDAVIGNGNGHTLFFRNSGSASSAAFEGSSDPFGFPDVGFSASPFFADIDADGDADAFIGDSNGDILFFRNSGTASSPAFEGSSPAFGLANVGGSASPALADIDGDGDLDAFIGNGNGSTLYFLNTGTASSPAFAGSSLGFGFPGVGSLASPTFADIDADGDLDAFIGNYDGNVVFFRNSGGGVTTPNPNGIYAPGSVISIEVPFSEIVLVDTTGGLPTLLLETGATDRVATYSGGSGTRLLSFTYTVQTGDSSADLDYANSGALQLNGATIKDPVGNDADLNLPVPGDPGSLGANADLVLDGVAPAVRITPFAGSSIGFGLTNVIDLAAPYFADIDADGDLDTFIGNGVGSTIFFLNTGSATAAAFAGSSIGFGLPVMDQWASPSLVDIDADGDLDAFIGGAKGNTYYFENTGNASAAAFAVPTIAFDLTKVFYAANPTFADIDADGDLDAFIGNFKGETVFFQNTGSVSAPAFASSALLADLPSVGGSPGFASPSFADIDEDGDFDAYIGNNDGNTIYFQNTGSATAPAFAPSASDSGLPDVGYVARPTFADIDGDGDLDAFIGDGSGNTLFFGNIGAGVSSTNPNGAYGTGSVITILVPFTETVLVDITGGMPTLLLETGATDRAAVYSGGSGSSVLSFTYTVQAGDSSADLDYTSSSALQLNGATIKDPGGNDATLTLPAPGTAGSLGANGNLVIYSDLLLTGTPLADTLNGGLGNDTLDGLAGNDSLSGAAGNDSIIGGSGNDTLVGGTGNDTMDGGAGNDFYYVDTLADVVIDSAGSDTINSTITYTLPGFIEHLWLRDTAANGTGNNLDNRLYGNAVANLLDAGGGDDTLKGAAGDDTMLGGNGNDTLQGDSGIDSLSGGIGNDSLDGGVGNDTMDGGAGNDTYYVDTLADVVIDSGGSDTINSTISYTLPSFIEFLWLRDTAADGTGNSLANRIYGNAVNNILDGAGGADDMRGAAGNDTYIVDNVGDKVVETNAVNSGIDTIRSSVSYTTPDNVERIILTGTGAINATGNVLNNLVFGNSAANTLSGDAGNDDIRGANGTDSLIGGNGNDTLRGQLGNDTLTGGSGADRFRFDTVISGGNNVDLISDYLASDADVIELDQSIFTTLSAGSLPNTAFINGSAFTTAAQRILFTGTELYYDPDGTGSAASELFATTPVGTTITAANFLVLPGTQDA